MRGRAIAPPFYNAGNIDAIDIDGVSKKVHCEASAPAADMCA